MADAGAYGLYGIMQVAVHQRLLELSPPNSHQDGNRDELISMNSLQGRKNVRGSPMRLPSSLYLLVRPLFELTLSPHSHGPMPTNWASVHGVDVSDRRRIGVIGPSTST